MPGTTTTIIRARVAHTPRDPFAGEDALEAFDDGALAFAAGGAIAAVGAWPDVHRAHPEARVVDRRECLLLPGFVDTHVHYPQVAELAAMGLELLDWLRQRTLPEERLVGRAHLDENMVRAARHRDRQHRRELG